MKLLRIGEIARRAGVSVRTLHYYEEIGLLAAAGRTGSGHRLYGREAVERLLQIKSLQQLGLSLTDVAALLSGEAVSPRQVVANHLARIRTQREAIIRLEARLEQLADLLDGGAADDAEAMDAFLTAVEAMTMYEKYLTAEQVEAVNAMHATAGEAATSTWTAAIDGLREQMAAGMDPASAEVQALVEQWHEAAAAFVPEGDQSIHEGMVKAMHQEPKALEEHGLDAELFAYIGRAMAPGEHP